MAATPGSIRLLLCSVAGAARAKVQGQGRPRRRRVVPRSAGRGVGRWVPLRAGRGLSGPSPWPQVPASPVLVWHCAPARVPFYKDGSHMAAGSTLCPHLAPSPLRRPDSRR